MDPLTIGLAGLGGQLFSALQSRAINRRMQNILDTEREKSDAFYNLGANRDFLETNVAKGMTERLRKQIEDTNKRIESKAAISGATPEAVIAQKTALQDSAGDTLSKIAEQGTGYQQRAEDIYRREQSGLAGQQMGLEQMKQQSAANLSESAGNLMGTAAALHGFERLPAYDFWANMRTPDQTRQLNEIAQRGTKNILGY